MKRTLRFRIQDRLADRFRRVQYPERMRPREEGLLTRWDGFLMLLQAIQMFFLSIGTLLIGSFIVLGAGFFLWVLLFR